MSNSPEAPVPKLLYQTDSLFNELYDRGLEITGTPEAKRRRERFYNLVQFFLLSSELDGLIAECGCWRGLSSFILCNYLKKLNSSFDGAGYHVFDSFMGLSKPTTIDALSESLIEDLTRKFGNLEGAYAASLADVRGVLTEFPGIEYHEGWIPSVFEGLAECKYRFVHVDLDLYEPTRAALEYFTPRLVNGGLIVCDDYGSLLWPGARKAVDSFCLESGIPLIRVSTGQAVIWKRGNFKIRHSRELDSIRLSLAEAQTEVDRSRSELRVVEENAKASAAALRDESDGLRSQLNHLSSRFTEVKTEARAKRDQLMANLVEMRKQRDDNKAKLRQLHAKLRLAEERSQLLEQDSSELRTKLAEVREERDKAKARALQLAKRLSEVKEQLR